MKRPDLLILIATWEFFTAFSVLLGLGYIIILAFQEPTGWFRLDGAFLIEFGVGIILLFYLIAALFAGIGVLSGREYGRVLSLVHGGIGLLVFPVGTVIGVLQIVYLTRADIREYFK